MTRTTSVLPGLRTSGRINDRGLAGKTASGSSPVGDDKTKLQALRGTVHTEKECHKKFGGVLDPRNPEMRPCSRTVKGQEPPASETKGNRGKEKETS